MRIGIMSDSHGDAVVTRRAIEMLSELGAEYFFHCGDVCGTNVLAELAGHPCTFVWGNCDDAAPSMRKYVEKIGLTWPEAPALITLDGKHIAVYHGHERGFNSAADNERLDYIFHGHTHRRADYRAGHCRVINPGALYRADPRTCAILDLVTDELEFLKVVNGKD